jgi:excisionase family DNA binding protein
MKRRSTKTRSMPAIADSNAVTRHTRYENLPELLTVREAAAFTGVSVGTIYAMAASRDLAVVRFGRLFRVPREALRAHMQQQAQQPRVLRTA